MKKRTIMTVREVSIKQFIAVLLSLFLVISLQSASLAGEVQNGVFHVNAEEAKRVLGERDDIQVLDVRTSGEFEQGRIAGAINIDYYADDFAEQLKSLDPEVTYLVHCRSGVRSGKSLAILKSVGVSKLIHLDGGMKAWVKNGGDLDF